MSIRIKSLTVNGLGPIGSIQWVFKDVNLIYGKNEKGKTYLVEYLLSSLFKNVKNTRPMTDSGQVTIEGLESAPTVLKPKTKRKMEEYLFSGDIKPVDLSRLCVVKGGELSFLTGGEVSLTKSVLKEYLSDQRILDTIDKEIPVSIKTSSWMDGKIVGGRQAGKIENWNESKETIKEIDLIIEEVDNAYSLGEVKKMKDELVNVNQLILKQDKARRAYAFSLWQQIQEKNQELAKIPTEDLKIAWELLRKVVSNNELIMENQEEIAVLEPKYDHYGWLKTAIDECVKRPKAFSGKGIWLWVALAMISTLVTIVLAFIDYPPYYSLGAGLLSIVSIFLVIVQYHSRLNNNADRAEIERIFQEYEKKFGTKAESITTLINTDKSLTETYGKLTNLKEQVDQYKNELSNLRKDLKIKLEALLAKKVNVKDLEVVLNDLQKKRQSLEDEISVLQIQHATLNVPEEGYVKEIIEDEYNAAKLTEFNENKQILTSNIDIQEKALETIKNKICAKTHDFTTVDWEILIDHLRDKRENIVESAKQTQALIGSGILVSQVINEIRAQEDESISKALTSSGISEPIQALTHTYNGIGIEGNEIVAYNSIQSFPLSDLSTGAQEQVLLALRIGIATHILKDQKMFLILDDAFQHSDWERRKWLVDEMGNLASLGWQIIYFSMDDHIKGLFEDRIKSIFKDRYQMFILDN